MALCTVYYFLRRRIQNVMVEGLCFLSKLSYMTEIRFLTVKICFSVRQYLATVGFFVYFESNSILRPLIFLIMTFFSVTFFVHSLLRGPQPKRPYDQQFLIFPHCFLLTQNNLSSAYAFDQQ